MGQTVQRKEEQESKTKRRSDVKEEQENKTKRSDVKAFVFIF